MLSRNICQVRVTNVCSKSQSKVLLSLYFWKIWYIISKELYYCTIISRDALKLPIPRDNNFSSQGAKPRGMTKWVPRDWQYQCFPRNDRAIVFLHCLLNWHKSRAIRKENCRKTIANLPISRKFRQTIWFWCKKC